MSSLKALTYPPNTRCGLWLASGKEWSGWRLRSAVRDGDDITLKVPSGGDPPAANLTGSATGPVVETGYPFTNLVASWNATTPEGSSVEAKARVRMEGRWSRWYIMGQWAGAGRGRSVADQSDADGRVEIDTLVLHHPADACQLSVKFTGSAAAQSKLTLASLCWYNPHGAIPPAPAVSGDWDRTLPVPTYSQMIQDRRIAASCAALRPSPWS